MVSTAGRDDSSQGREGQDQRNNQGIFLRSQELQLQRMPYAAGSMDWNDIGHFLGVGWQSLLSIQVPVVENHCGETSRAPLNRIEIRGEKLNGK